MLPILPIIQCLYRNKVFTCHCAIFSFGALTFSRSFIAYPVLGMRFENQCVTWQ